MREQTTQQTMAKPIVMPLVSGLLQHACACGRHDTSSGSECDGCKKKRQGTLKRAAVNNSPTREVPPIVHEVLRSPGQPLDAKTRAFMEPRFGRDFSGVRVHTDAKAAESARAVNALAYTVSHDVVFGAGQYAPRSSAGQRLIAHELTHVVQQGGTVVDMQQMMRMGRSNEDEFEKEADFQAELVTKDQTAEATRLQNCPDQPVLQRQADITKAPSGLPCLLVSGSGHPLGLNYVFDQSKTELSPEGRADIALLIRMDFTKDGVPDKIIVHGFASVEGPQEFNWQISCARAEAIKAELVRNGVLADKITTIAHGESTEFSATNLSENRRAIIETVYPPKPVQRKPYPKVSVWVNSFIPHERVEGPPLHECFAGDNRGFSSDPSAPARTHQLMELVGDTNVLSNIRRIGTTHEVECDTGQVIDSDIASEDDLNNEVFGGRTSADVTVVFEADASNPLVLAAPAINLEAEFRLNLAARQCIFEIDHDGFPAYEAYIKPSDGPVVTVYTYDPRAQGEGIGALFPPMDWTGTRRISF